MMGSDTTRQRQSMETDGAGLPAASQAESVISTSLLEFGLLGSLTSVRVAVTKNGLLERAVATTLTGAAKARTRGRQTYWLSRNVAWPLAPVVVSPLASSRFASVQVSDCGKMMMLRHEE